MALGTVPVTPGAGENIAVDINGGTATPVSELIVDGALVSKLAMVGLPVTPIASELGQVNTGSYPQPTNIVTAATAASNQDAFGNTMVRGPVLTDEQGVYDCFVGTPGPITGSITGTCTFTLGSDQVTGLGTAFTTQAAFTLIGIQQGMYVRLSADTEAAWTQVSSVESDTSLTLVKPYTDTGGVGSGLMSNWATVTAAGGGSITRNASNLVIVNSLANNAATFVYRAIDTSPLMSAWHGVQFTGGVANQTMLLGWQDIPGAPTFQAAVVFDGALPTNQVRFIVFNANDSDDTSTTLVTLPNGWVVTQYLHWQVSVTERKAILEVWQGVIAPVVVAKSPTHFFAPYVQACQVMGLLNSASLGGSATLSLDSVAVVNHDRVEVAMSWTGDPLPVALTAISGSTGLPVNVATALDGSLTTTQTPGLTALLNNATLTVSGSMIVTGIGRKEVILGLSITGAVTNSGGNLTFNVQELDPVNLTSTESSPGQLLQLGPFASTGHTAYGRCLNYTSACLVTWTVTGATPSYAGVNLWLLNKEPTTLPMGAGRTRCSVVYQAAATATADTLLSMTKWLNGQSAMVGTSTSVSFGSYFRITSMTFSVKAGAAAAAFATFSVRINYTGVAVIGSPCEFRVDVGNTEAVVGAARSITVPLPDGLELDYATQIAVSAACQATTNVLTVSLNGYEY